MKDEREWHISYDAGRAETPYVISFGGETKASFRIESEALQYVARQVALRKSQRLETLEPTGSPF